MSNDFEYNSIIQFAKEYINIKNIPLEKVLTSGIRIDSPGDINKDYKNVRSIFIAGEAFFVNGNSICSKLNIFEWSKGLFDLRIYSPDYLEFPDCKTFMYLSKKVRGYSCKEDWSVFSYDNTLTFSEGIILVRFYMLKDSLICSKCRLDSCETTIINSKSKYVSYISNIMNFIGKPVKEIIVLSSSNMARLRKCNDGEYMVVLGG